MNEGIREEGASHTGNKNMNIDTMCIQETKLSDSTIEKRKGHTFV